MLLGSAIFPGVPRRLIRPYGEPLIHYASVKTTDTAAVTKTCLVAIILLLATIAWQVAPAVGRWRYRVVHATFGFARYPTTLDMSQHLNNTATSLNGELHTGDRLRSTSGRGIQGTQGDYFQKAIPSAEISLSQATLLTSTRDP